MNNNIIMKSYIIIFYKKKNIILVHVRKIRILTSSEKKNLGKNRY